MSSVRVEHDRIEVAVDAIEAEVLIELVGELGELLDADQTQSPALSRLLPDGHRDDATIAAEQRALTEDSLRADKRGATQLVLSGIPVGGGAVELRAEDPDVWLRVLTDIRLMLGVELDITADSAPPRRVRSHRDMRMSMYFWLTGLQDSLVVAVLN